MAQTTLILGGARSGKSQFAEQIVLQSGKNPVYIATAQSFDAEMQQKIERHQTRRGKDWQLIEVPFELVEAIENVGRSDKIILVDCLTLWLSNLILMERDVEEEGRRLCNLVAQPPSDLILVSNEVGLSIVPDNVLARRFRDANGLINQYIAAVAKKVYLVTAGLPLCLKD